MTHLQQLDGYFEISVDSMRERFDTAMRCCLDNQKSRGLSNSVSATALNTSMQQLFTILDKLAPDPSAEEERARTVLKQEVTDLPDYGIGLLDQLRDSALKLNCEEASDIFEQLSLPLAIWFARHKLVLHNIEFIVNAISNTANQTQDQQHLVELADAIDVIIEMFSPEIKADLDKSNSGRPWRVLNLNQAIIATRSLDPKRMEIVFEQLVFRLPEDAPGFFAEGMEQMDIIDYPVHVRQVMQTYYQLTNQPTLH